MKRLLKSVLNLEILVFLLLIIITLFFIGQWQDVKFATIVWYFFILPLNIIRYTRKEN